MNQMRWFLLIHTAGAWKGFKQAGSRLTWQGGRSNPLFGGWLPGGVGLKTLPEQAAPPLPSSAFTDNFEPDSPAKADWISNYLRGQTTGSHVEEEDYFCEVEGTLPQDLRGTLFRNGPGRLEARGGHVYAHSFDGDGMITAFYFSGNGKSDGVRVRNRFVRSAEFEAEERSADGSILFRNTFGTQPQGGWRRNLGRVWQKNVANTNVVWFGGRLLALWEAAQPHRLDPRTLATVGLDLLDDRLSPGMPFSTGNLHLDRLLRGLVGNPITAHPKIVEGSSGQLVGAGVGGRRLVCYGYRAKPSLRAVLAGEGAFDSELTVYEFDEKWTTSRTQVGF